MRFNIVHIVGGLKVSHGLIGHSEVIETIQWGLSQLGHDVIVSVNRIEPSRVNLIVGGQVLPPEQIAKLPPETIFYQFEQIAGVPREGIRTSIHEMAKGFRIWDYSARNLATWRELKAIHEPIHVPVGYAPLLNRIGKREEDIDVLFYGLPSASRMQVFSDVCRVAPTCIFACGVYFKQRDELIARSKLILNFTLFPKVRIFEIVRISYLLANEKAVVSDIYPDSEIEADLKDAVAFAPPDELVERVEDLLGNPEKRRELEVRGAEAFRKRDIRGILAKAIEGMK